MMFSDEMMRTGTTKVGICTLMRYPLLFC